VRWESPVDSENWTNNPPSQKLYNIGGKSVEACTRGLTISTKTEDFE